MLPMPTMRLPSMLLSPILLPPMALPPVWLHSTSLPSLALQSTPLLPTLLQPTSPISTHCSGLFRSRHPLLHPLMHLFLQRCSTPPITKSKSDQPCLIRRKLTDQLRPDNGSRPREGQRPILDSHPSSFRGELSCSRYTVSKLMISAPPTFRSPGAPRHGVAQRSY